MGDSWLRFSVEMTPPRSFGRWDLASMVETRGRFGGTVRREGCEERSERDKDGRLFVSTLFDALTSSNNDDLHVSCSTVVTR